MRYSSALTLHGQALLHLCTCDTCHTCHTCHTCGGEKVTVESNFKIKFKISTTQRFNFCLSFHIIHFCRFPSQSSPFSPFLPCPIHNHRNPVLFHQSCNRGEPLIAAPCPFPSSRHHHSVLFHPSWNRGELGLWRP